MKRLFTFAAVACLLTSAAFAGTTQKHTIHGTYIESRTCDVYTAACFANAEVGLNGKEAILAWNIEAGKHNGVALDGLKVSAVVRANATLGDKSANPFPAKAIVYVDESATAEQRAALVSFAKEMGEGLVSDVIRVEAAPIAMNVDACGGETCATLKVSDIAAIEARCLHSDDKKCGNDEPFYTPLTKISMAMPHFTTYEKFSDAGLGINWSDAGRRGTYVGHFAK